MSYTVSISLYTRYIIYSEVWLTPTRLIYDSLVQISGLGAFWFFFKLALEEDLHHFTQPTWQKEVPGVESSTKELQDPLRRLSRAACGYHFQCWHTTRFTLSMEKELADAGRGGRTRLAKTQILRRERGQGKKHFLCSVDHEQDCQLYSVDPYSSYKVLTMRIYP